jgi:hypothetical protein
MIHPNPGDPVPSVISISAHLVSGDDTTTIGLDGVSTNTIDQLHKLFQNAATMGITVFVSSGDIGSSRDFNPDNLAHVGYPASDPMVTSCGGTTIGTDASGQPVEVTWNDTDILDNVELASGGGISYYFPEPDWQIDPSVAFDGVVPPSVNPDRHRGRGVPDVAGNASGNSGYPMTLTTFSSPIFFHARGTSAVAPLYAGLMALINADLSQNVGFLNPTLYYLGIPSRHSPFRPKPPFPFRDITDGNNQWQNNPRFYTARPGWDACTGWGSINGSALLQALKQLTRENGWRWCKKCQGMFFVGADFPFPMPFHGVCPKDGLEHDPSESGAYAAVLGDNGRSQQGGWRLCGKCGGMFFALNPTQGVCPADTQPHESIQIDGKPTHYAAVFGGDETGQQGGWKWCQKCQGMFFAGNPGQDVCPVNDPVNGKHHDGSLSGNYAMPWQS